LETCGEALVENARAQEPSTDTLSEIAQTTGLRNDETIQNAATEHRTHGHHCWRYRCWTLRKSGFLILLLVALVLSATFESFRNFAVDVVSMLGADSMNECHVISRLGGIDSSILKLQSSKPNEALDAADALMQLDEGCMPYIAELVKANVFNLLWRMSESSKGKEAEYATGALGRLAVDSAYIREVLFSTGAFYRYVAMLQSKKGREAEYAARLLIIAGMESRKRCVFLVNSHAIGPLAHLLQLEKSSDHTGASRPLAMLLQSLDMGLKDAGLMPIQPQTEGSGCYNALISSA